MTAILDCSACPVEASLYARKRGCYLEQGGFQMGEEHREHYLPSYEPTPRGWAPHPTKKMLMTPWLVFFGGIFAFAVPTLVGAFFHLAFFHPSFSNDWAPINQAAIRGRHVYVSNGCIYCHSSYTRPQDVRSGLYYLYPRTSEPGDFVSSDSSPNVWGSARIGPDLINESGYHPRDWERAHFSDPRFVTPNSIMPRFVWMTKKEVEDLTTFLERRSGKSGLVRLAGQEYMKKLLLKANNLPPPPTGFTAEKLTLADVARAQMNAPSPPSGKVDGLSWPDPVNLNIVDRSYWLSSNPMPVTTDNLMRGRKLFQDMCIGCHGQGGGGVSLAARYMSPMPASFTDRGDAASGTDTSPGDFYYRILRGIHGSAMENFGTRLRVEDIWKVVLFLKTIPNGGLQLTKTVTPDMYIQWKPPPDLLAYISKHPVTANKDYIAPTVPDTRDPWMLEAERVLYGMNQTDKFILPGVGEVSLRAARNEIKRRYDQMLDEGWRDYAERKGFPPLQGSQKSIPPDLPREFR